MGPVYLQTFQHPDVSVDINNAYVVGVVQVVKQWVWFEVHCCIQALQ